MDTVVQLCLGIVIVAVPIGLLVGYTLMAMGIADAFGPFLGLVAFVTIFPVFLFAPLGIGVNHKIDLGGKIFIVSIAVALATAGIISFFGLL